MKSYIEQKFPRIANKLVEVWKDQDEANAYLQSLLFKEKERVYRQGFDPEILAEIMMLSSLVNNPSPEDIWHFAYYG